jgi:hypothetical protein
VSLVEHNKFILTQNYPNRPTITLHNILYCRGYEAYGKYCPSDVHGGKYMIGVGVFFFTMQLSIFFSRKVLLSKDLTRMQILEAFKNRFMLVSMVVGPSCGLAYGFTCNV